MPYSTAQVSSYIASAQRALADYVLQIVRLEENGDDTKCLYSQGRYLSDAIRVLQFTNNGLSPDDIETIVHCMIENGINDYSNTIIPFTPVTIVFPPTYVAKLSTLTDGPGGGTGTLVGNELRVPAVNVSGSAWEYKKPGFQGTIIYVSPSGVPSSVEKGSLIYHYQTGLAAQSAAASGDTIVFLPAIYSESGLGKDGVTYYFMPGASNVATSSMFTLSSAMTVTVRGNGVFTNTSNNVFSITHASAILDAQFDKALNSTTAAVPVNITAGKAKLKGYIKSTYNNVAGHCITKSGTSTLILDDVTMITTNASAFDVSAGSAQSVLVYKAQTNVAIQDSNITCIINSIERDNNYQ